MDRHRCHEGLKLRHRRIVEPMEDYRGEKSASTGAAAIEQPPRHQPGSPIQALVASQTQIHTI